MPSHLYPSFHHVTYDTQSLLHGSAFLRSRLSAFPAHADEIIFRLPGTIPNDLVTRLLSEQAQHLRTVATELLQE